MDGATACGNCGRVDRYEVTRGLAALIGELHLVPPLAAQHPRDE